MKMNDLQTEATFLGKWSKGKPITKEPVGEWYRCGRFITRIAPTTVKALLDKKIATGSVAAFTVPKVTKTKADREAELD